MTSVLTEICFDCADPERLARFWCDVLGWQVAERGDGWVEIRDPAAPPPDRGGVVLIFDRVPEGKAAKNRVHLDVNPVDRDQAAELARLLSLGAREVDVGQGDVQWHVLADPEGNEFCLLRTQLSREGGDGGEVVSQG
jgi:catechol 2,3-dioxygenase-like lactoylglutathione lyase family enzyme